MIDNSSSWAEPNPAFQALHTLMTALVQKRASASAMGCAFIIWEQRHHMGPKKELTYEEIGRLACPQEPYDRKAVQRALNWLRDNDFIFWGRSSSGRPLGQIMLKPYFLATVKQVIHKVINRLSTIRPTGTNLSQSNPPYNPPILQEKVTAQVL